MVPTWTGRLHRMGAGIHSKCETDHTKLSSHTGLICLPQTFQVTNFIRVPKYTFRDPLSMEGLGVQSSCSRLFCPCWPKVWAPKNYRTPGAKDA